MIYVLKILFKAYSAIDFLYFRKFCSRNLIPKCIWWILDQNPILKILFWRFCFKSYVQEIIFEIMKKFVPKDFSK